MPSTDPGLILKVSPPKLRKNLLRRERLQRMRDGQDAALFLIEAPAGYGKTSLLSQWRLDWLQSGALVAWYDSDAGDSAQTILRGLVEGLRRASGQADFAQRALGAQQQSSDTLPALTELLAEIAEAAAPVILIFDNGERLTEADALELLDYLLHNLPPNLQIVIATRNRMPFASADLLSHGQLCYLTNRELSFDFAETLHFLQSLQGQLTDTDLCARLYELTEGWPLGLHLATLALTSHANPLYALESLFASRDNATQLLFSAAMASLPERLREFVLRCALLDALHPELCAAVSGDADAAHYLRQLLADTPLLTATEQDDWLRFHPLAREYLRTQAAQSLTEEALEQVHLAAWHWFSNSGNMLQAVQHALETQRKEEAYALLSSSMRGFMLQGQSTAMLAMIALVPEKVIRRSPQLCIWAGVCCLLSNQLQQAPGYLLQVLDMSSATVTDREDATAWLAIVVGASERYVSAAHYLQQLPAQPLQAETSIAAANMQCYLQLQQGATALARRTLSGPAKAADQPAGTLHGQVLAGYSHLWEGQPLASHSILSGRYPFYERLMGRRNAWTTLHASMLAAACWERNEREQARLLLANRLDLMRCCWIPEGSCYGHLVLVQLACSDGDTRRAFLLLDNLHEMGLTHGLVHPQGLALLERIRLHAIQQQPALCRPLLVELEALCDNLDPEKALLLPQLQLQHALANAYTALATDDDHAAQTWLEQAGALAAQLNRGRERVQVLALRAQLTARSGADANGLLSEALALAEDGDQVRVCADTWPELIGLIRQWRDNGAAANTSISPDFIARVLRAAESLAAPSSATAAKSTRSAMLTPKENDVLQLLAGGLSNKRIASSLDLSGETIKWHLKKLFGKLNAGSREHAVRRAQMLGLID